MRVVMVSKALVVGAYQRKAEELAKQGIELTVFTPSSWGDQRGRQVLERQHTNGYELRALPVRFNHNFHLHHYPTLARELAVIRPALLHMDEEPYNLATWLGVRAAHRLGIPSLFFTWQNLYRRYPPPFSWFEQQNYHMAASAIAGNQEAVALLCRKGYQGKICVIPQFGVDPVLFCPTEQERTINSQRGASQERIDPKSKIQNPKFTIGYAGGLLPEKGVDLLLRACAGLQGDWRVEICGEGREQPNLQQLSNELQIESRVHFHGRINSSAMPRFYQRLDVLVVPSRTLPNWKEQFGRVLIEAMACQVPVIGSNSGEIPNVIGQAGRIVPEADVAALRDCLQQLYDDPAQRQQLGQLGRQRVFARYTMQQIVTQTVEVYQSILCTSPSTPCS